MIGSAEHPLLTFGLPPDLVAWSAVFLALVVLVARRPKTSPGTMLAVLAISAAALSWGYFAYYLDGAPRIIDATTYLLQARNFSEGSFSFPAHDPTASFRGRFLIHTAEDATRLAGIFPPGYPALLAVGLRLGSYQLVGPLTAAALVLMTYNLTLSITRRKRDALVGACLSALCACLRYHSADTMSHGWAALLCVTAVWASVELLRKNSHKMALVLGGSLGLLIATRQLTGILILVSTLSPLLFIKRRHAFPDFFYVAAGLMPGIVLLLTHQHAVTGDWFLSPQFRYYALADGPADCFRPGLGSGCHYEHADVVVKHGNQGLTLKWAGLNTLHRLHFHLMDIANFEPIILAALFIIVKARRRRLLWPMLSALLLLPAGYSLFYFAGSYPGGGARLFAELLPLWHALIAFGLCSLRMVRWGIFSALFGFAVHASFSHGMLREPHFGPRGADVAEVSRLLDQHQGPRSKALGERSGVPVVFFSTAHDFNLALESSPHFIAARSTRDDREQMLLQNLKAPSAFRFGRGEHGPELVPIEAHSVAQGGSYVLETEFDYPPRSVRDLWVHPEHVGAPCASQGRALALHIDGNDAHLSLEATGVKPGHYQVDLVALRQGSSCETISLGEKQLPAVIELGPELLRNLSHIDRTLLTFTHH